jgi:hypothetical protein
VPSFAYLGSWRGGRFVVAYACRARNGSADLWSNLLSIVVRDTVGGASVTGQWSCVLSWLLTNEVSSGVRVARIPYYSGRNGIATCRATQLDEDERRFWVDCLLALWRIGWC